MSNRIFIPIMLLVCVLILVVVALLIPKTSISQPNPLIPKAATSPSVTQFYDYSDSTTYVPASLSSGMVLNVVWARQPATPQLYEATTPPQARVSITLSVELVTPSALQQREQRDCSTVQPMVLLDTLRTNNWNGALLYQRHIPLPPHLPPGIYYLLRLVKSPVEATCFATKVALVL